jgi:hypothetical protein
MRERRKKAREATRREKQKKAQEAARQYAQNMATIAKNNIRLRELEAIMDRNAIEASEARIASALIMIEHDRAAAKVLALSGWGPGVNPVNTNKLEEIDGADDTDTDTDEDEDMDDTDDTDTDADADTE